MNMSTPLQRVTSLCRCAHCPYAASASYILLRVQDGGGRRAPKLDEPIVQEVPGVKPAMHHSLVTPVPFADVEYSDERVDSFVCLSASISPELRVRSSQISMHVTNARGSLLLWRHCDAIGYVLPVLLMTSWAMDVCRYRYSDWHHCVIVRRLPTLVVLLKSSVIYKDTGIRPSRTFEKVF